MSAGVVEDDVLPMPNCPLALLPHDHTNPLLSRASACEPLAATLTMLLRPVTDTGDVRCVVVPSPSCPFTLLPHADTVPLLLTAKQ